MLLEIGQVLDGKYRIVRMLGEGGMGAVFEGENLRVRRRVAIKVLHPELAANDETVRRFEREAQAAGRIGSDHILEVIDLGAMPNGQRFMVMEYLDGEPLSARIARQGRLSPHEVAPLALQVLEGLAAAHEAGIVHRDLKPDNIYILREKANVRDFVKIIDFGISKMSLATAEPSRLTRTGAVMGTPYYLSPEQANGSRDIDGRSDLYSLGVILYEAVTGKVPFDARSFNELLFKIVLADPLSLDQFAPDLDRDFCAIVIRAMARDREHRFQSCAELANALQSWLCGRALDPYSDAAARPAFAPFVPVPGAATAAVAQRAGPPAQGFPALVAVPPWTGPDVGRTLSDRTSDVPSIPGVRSSGRLLLFGGVGLALVAAIVLLVVVVRIHRSTSSSEAETGNPSDLAGSASASAVVSGAPAGSGPVGSAANAHGPEQPMPRLPSPSSSSLPSEEVAALPTWASEAAAAPAAGPAPLRPGSLARAPAAANSLVGTPLRPKNQYSWNRPDSVPTPPPKAVADPAAGAVGKGSVDIDMGY